MKLFVNSCCFRKYSSIVYNREFNPLFCNEVLMLANIYTISVNKLRCLTWSNKKKT